MKRIFTLQLVVVSAFVVNDTAALAAQFQLIPSPTGGYGAITAMSADGNTIIGSDDFGNSFVWTPASGSTSLGLTDALPLAVSPSGDAIVGLMGSAPTAFQIVKNVFSSLPDLPGGANASCAYGVSRVKTGTAPLVVGQGNSTAGSSASVWTGPSSINALSLPSGASLPSIANDINPYADLPGKRVIAGTANVSGVNHAMKWTGALQTPTLLDSNPSEALAMNSDGSLIAGQSNNNATIWQTGQSPITMSFASQFDGVIGNSSHVLAVGTERSSNRYGFLYDSLMTGSQKHEIIDSILNRLGVLTSLGLNSNPGNLYVSGFHYAGSSSGNHMLVPNVVGISSNGKVLAGNAHIDSSGCACLFFTTAWRLVLDDPYLDPRIGDFVAAPFTAGAYTFLGSRGGGTWFEAGNRKYVFAQTDGTTDFTAVQFPGFLDAQFIVSDGINGDTEVQSGSLYTFPVPVTEFTYRLSSGVLPEEGFPIFLRFTDEFVSEFSLQSVPEPFSGQLAMVGLLALCRCRIHRKSSTPGVLQAFAAKAQVNFVMWPRILFDVAVSPARVSSNSKASRRWLGRKLLG